MTRDCRKLDATQMTSRRGPCNGAPGTTTAAASAATNALLPPPRPIEIAASPGRENAPRRKRRSHGQTVNGCPSRSPPDSVSVPSHSIRAAPIVCFTGVNPRARPLPFRLGSGVPVGAPCPTGDGCDGMVSLSIIRQ